MDKFCVFSFKFCHFGLKKNFTGKVYCKSQILVQRYWTIIAPPQQMDPPDKFTASIDLYRMDNFRVYFFFNY